MKNRLKDLREDHDFTQQMVADKIGITQRKYSYVETGTQQLTAELLVPLAQLYTVSIDYLPDGYSRPVSALLNMLLSLFFCFFQRSKIVPCIQ